ncbi:bifunctional diaminohydroxyphosphoribosylaminopyrimidine deaminase/5-amino-6-(5-phosphoribosylamino)uracil reductase RibD [Niameybacter massiliensis]|uniref:bifunctional diaminohydroxyphosphoribosylaminopyrimidine deaminase/5-amino-6-(5-phosphoribosylamino)uracil reductase RibD n=1 Tax=Niameybacter massiliensis TaxID=1658108 RepID=UPI0006B55B4A|nr:bifunctional diaminohydroxyphosphoribosylaminopyrimidine deaminase/5-amino-6-(5-phosphoribosylamino)uracil reductase RibD [Niameybacter massiliensis]
MTDQEYMTRALELARKGCGFVSPNPMVGAVIVKNNKVIGQGWHEKYGQLHAERNALVGCKESPHGATLYVTLEPCCHYGKTPPCTDAILESGITRVVIGALDPNPLVSGKGVSILQAKGIEVVSGVLEKECLELNQVFFHYIKTKTPYVVMKYAMTMDGKIATSTGKSKWITGDQARIHVHKERHRYTGIMVGVGTVIADNPMLTCRLENGCNPIRIICDTHLRTPLNAQVVATASSVRTIIATCCAEKDRYMPYEIAGCEILLIPKKDNHIDLQILMQQLGILKIDSLILEGGGTLNASAMQSGIVNKVQAYIAPKLFGGDEARTPIGGSGIDEPTYCFKMKNQKLTWFGEDLLLESEVEYLCLQE